MNLPIALRAAKPEDIAFFYSATLQSNLYSSNTYRSILPPVYYRGHKKVLERLLEAPGSRMIVACMEDAPEVIIGFALAGHERLLHYVYVKRPFRKFGVARKMLEHLDISPSDCVTSHWTDDATEILRAKRLHGLVYNPYVLME